MTFHVFVLALAVGLVYHEFIIDTSPNNFIGFLGVWIIISQCIFIIRKLVAQYKKKKG